MTGRAVPGSIAGMAALLLIAQALVGPPAPRAPQPPAPPDAACSASNEDGEITVCARRAESPRLTRLLPPAGVTPSDPLAFRLPGGGKGRLRAIQSTLPGGTGQGAAVTLTLPFGKGAK